MNHKRLLFFLYITFCIIVKIECIKKYNKIKYITSSMSDTCYIYLIHEREFHNANKPIFKIGKTRQKHNERFKQYPNGSKLLIQITVDDCDKAERDLIKLFKEKYKWCKFYGNEYFEGDSIDMLNDIREYHLRTIVLKKNIEDTFNKKPLILNKSNTERKISEKTTTPISNIDWDIEIPSSPIETFNNEIITNKKVPQHNMDEIKPVKEKDHFTKKHNLSKSSKKNNFVEKNNIENVNINDDTLKFINNEINKEINISILEASKTGNITILTEYLNTILYSGTFVIGSEIDLAAANGHTNVLEWFYRICEKTKIEFNFTEIALDQASANGHIEVLEWFFKHSIEYLKNSTEKTLKLQLKYTENAIILSCTNNHIKILDWWLKYSKSGGSFIYNNKAIDAAASYGNIDVLNWFYKLVNESKQSTNINNDFKEFKYSSNALLWASTKGHIHVLEWFFEHSTYDWLKHNTSNNSDYKIKLEIPNNLIESCINAGAKENIINWWFETSILD